MIKVANRLSFCSVRPLHPTRHSYWVFFYSMFQGRPLCFVVTIEAIKATEDVGFYVVQVAAYSHRVSNVLFREPWGHTCPSSASLNAWRPAFPFIRPKSPHRKSAPQFLQKTKKLLDGEQLIQGCVYLKKLLDTQTHLPEEPVRVLTPAYMETNNQEKMKVLIAMLIF